MVIISQNDMKNCLIVQDQKNLEPYYFALYPASVLCLQKLSFEGCDHLCAIWFFHVWQF